MTLSCIMVVDDSEPDQFINKAVIGKYDPIITLMQAYDGQEALDMLAEGSCKPDVIFLDINMPGMDGHTFLDIYDTQQAENSAMVVMLTSSAQERDRERSTIYKCVKRYFLKPLSEKKPFTLANGRPHRRPTHFIFRRTREFLDEI